MKNFYALNWFNTREKRIQSIARETQEEIYSEMLSHMQSIPHDPCMEKVDYDWDGEIMLAKNLHNGWLREADGTEWFFSTTCYYLV